MLFAVVQLFSRVLSKTGVRHLVNIYIRRILSVKFTIRFDEPWRSLLCLVL